MGTIRRPELVIPAREYPEEPCEVCGAPAARLMCGCLCDEHEGAWQGSEEFVLAVATRSALRDAFVKRARDERARSAAAEAAS